MRKKGSALVLAVMVIAMLLVGAVFLVKIVYTTYETGENLILREQAFWLAEAGAEKGKTELARNPGWFTDLPHTAEDDLNWIGTQAAGWQMDLGNGRLKIVRERERNYFFAVGMKGKAQVVLKIKYSALPLKVLSWEQI